MKLKTQLRRNIEKDIKKLNEKLENCRYMIDFLQTVDTQKARYIVSLGSYWAQEGEKSISTRHFGTLEESIKIAEKDFKKINNRSDVQAGYRVHIKLGKREYLVPKEYWEVYKEK